MNRVLPGPNCELPKTLEGGGSAGVKDRAEGGGPAGVVDMLEAKLSSTLSYSLTLGCREIFEPGVEGGLEEKGTVQPDILEAGSVGC